MSCINSHVGMYVRLSDATENERWDWGVGQCIRPLVEPASVARIELLARIRVFPFS
jgi:hypothetical protein